MESVDIRDYKDAIMEAAWETGIRFIATTSWGASGLAERPTLYIVTTFLGKEELVPAFCEVLNKMTGDPLLFFIDAISYSDYTLMGGKVVFNGKWIMV